MSRCIYCLRADPAVDFAGTEHVIPQAFGLFAETPTLNGCVCDACNASLGRELDLYLGRGTPEGLLRFRFGIQDPVDYKHLGRRSTITTRPVTGRWAGATVWYQEHEGQLVPFVAPQVGIAKTREGPYVWFPRDRLPTKEQVREICGTGGGAVEFIGIGHGEDNETDIEAVKDEMRAVGVVFSGPHLKTMERGLQPTAERIEDGAKLGPLFFRCVAKICLNYFAFVCGAEPVLGSAFDPIRSFIVDGTLDERLVQAVGAGSPNPLRKRGDTYRVGFRRHSGGIQGHLRLLTGCVWAKQLTVEPDGVPIAAAMHEYALDTMTATRCYPPMY